MDPYCAIGWFILGGVVGSLLLILFRWQKSTGRAVSRLNDMDEHTEAVIKSESVLVKTTEDSSNAIIMISKAYYLGISGFQEQNIRLLDEILAEVDEFNQRAKRLKTNAYRVIEQLHHDSIETGHYYVQIVDYLREMAHSIKYVILPLNDHLKQDLKPFAAEPQEELYQFSSLVTDFLNFALHIIKESRFEQLDELIQKRQALLEAMREQEKHQIRRIKKREIPNNSSVLYFSLMSETKHLLLQTVNLLKSTRDFVSYTKSFKA